MDFEFWMISGTLLLALVLFGIGASVRLNAPPLAGPPPLAPRPGLGGWRVGQSIYRPMDLGVVALLVFFYSSALLIDLFGEKPGPELSPTLELDAGVLVINAVMQFFFVALIIAVVAWRKRPIEWLGLRWKWWPLVIPMGIVGTLTTYAFGAGLYAAGYQDWLLENLGMKDQAEAAQEVVRAFTETKSNATLVMLCVTAVIVAPVAEEVIFRGYIYPVAKRFAGRWAGIAFSSLLFAMVHHSAFALLPLCFLAVLLALSYEVTGSIWAPIGIHMAFNGSTVLAQLAMRYEWIDPSAL